MRTLTREQDATVQFKQSYTPVLAASGEFRGESLKILAQAVFTAISLIGEAEATCTAGRTLQST